MKTLPILVMVVCGALAGSSPLLLAGQTAATQSTGVNSTETSPAAAVSADTKNNSGNHAAKLSWGLDDVVKLSKAGVDESVILSYIQNSGVGYNPTAQDIIRLRELGVSPQITTALMQRGSEVRQTAAVEAQKQAQATAPAVAPAPAATTTQPATVYAAPTYVAPVSTVTYIGYPRTSYAYSYGGCYSPSYYSYPYYPRYYGYTSYPRVSFGVSFGGGHFGGFRGGFHGGFRHCR